MIVRSQWSLPKNSYWTIMTYILSYPRKRSSLTLWNISQDDMVVTRQVQTLRLAVRMESARSPHVSPAVHKQSAVLSGISKSRCVSGGVHHHGSLGSSVAPNLPG